MPMDNVTLENTQQSISSRDAKSVASVMVNGKWVNLSDTLEQANVKSDVGTVAKQVAAQQEVVSNAASTADSAVAYANDAIKKSRVNSQAIEDINSAVSDAASDAAVARSDGLWAWNAAQSNVNLIDLNYASASAAISSTRTEALAAADEAKKSASAAQADIVAVRSDVAAVQADVTATRSDVAVAKSDIADTKTTLEQTASGFSSQVTSLINNAMQNRGTVDSPDFNSLTQAGYYTITSPSNGKNYPTGNWGTLEVSGQATDINGRLNQKYVSDNNGTAYTRQYNANTKGWTAWVKVANQSDIDTLNGKIIANTTAIEQNKTAIALKADQTTVDKTNGDVQQLQSQLKVQAGQIASKVSSSDLDAKGYATQTYTQTQIKQTSDSWNANLASVKDGLMQSYTNLHATVDGIQAEVYNKDGSSKITQLSSLIASKVSQGDYNSQITQLKNDINQRVQVGDVISQINQEAGGDTLIQVSNGKKSLILDAGNTVFTGKAWIPVAAIANLTADQIQAGTLSGSKVHAGDNSGNAIDMGALSTNYVGFHAYANNGDNTFIDLNGIHNYGASYDTRIQQGKITTNYLAVNGGGMIDFRDSTGTGMIADGSTLTFDVSNTPAGYLTYNGMPIAELPDGSGGNELAIRYRLSTSIIPDDNSGAQATFSKAAQKIAYMTGTNQGKQMLSGLEVHSNNHHWLCAVNSDATCNRFEVNDRDGLNIAWHDNTHLWISDGKAKLYKDNNDSQTATELEVHGWAWVNGWVEAAGHSTHSALSTKTDIQPVDNDKMLKMVNDTDLTTYLYKTDVASGETHRHIGLIIDDVHDVAQYQAPQDFIAPNGVSRDDDNMIGALFGAVKALTKRIKTLESKVG